MGVSMNTTLNDGEKIIINKLAYFRKEPKRNDVIVFSQSKSGHGYYNIKRVIGLPGETVEIVNGEVYINGVKLEEVIPVEKRTIGKMWMKRHMVFWKVIAKEAGTWYNILSENANRIPI